MGEDVEVSTRQLVGRRQRSKSVKAVTPRPRTNEAPPERPAWPDYTELQFTHLGKVALTNLHPKLRKVAYYVLEALRIHLISKNAFPDQLPLLKINFLRGIGVEAARQAGDKMVLERLQIDLTYSLQFNDLVCTSLALTT